MSTIDLASTTALSLISETLDGRKFVSSRETRLRFRPQDFQHIHGEVDGDVLIVVAFLRTTSFAFRRLAHNVVGKGFHCGVSNTGVVVWPLFPTPRSEENVDGFFSSCLRMMDVTTFVANASGGLYKALFSSFMRSQISSADSKSLVFKQANKKRILLCFRPRYGDFLR